MCVVGHRPAGQPGSDGLHSLVPLRDPRDPAVRPVGSRLCAGTVLLLGSMICLAPGRLLAEAESGNQPDSTHRSAFAGLAVEPVDSVVHRHLPDTGGAGLTVRAVATGSPAARAGLLRHDILLQWGDQRLFTPGQLRGLLRTFEPGHASNLTLLRQGTEQRVELVLAARPNLAAAGPEIRVASVAFGSWQDGSDLARHLAEVVQPATAIQEPVDPTVVDQPERLLGFEWRWADEAVLAQLGLGDGVGGVIDTVQAGAPAARAGLQPADFIVALQGVALTGPDEFAERMGNATTGSLLTFRVWRSGQTLEVQMNLPAPVAGATTAGEVRSVSPAALGAGGDWIQTLGREVAWIILLESQTSSSPTRAAAAAPTEVLLDDPFSPGPGLGVISFDDDRGSIEVQQRGGRDHYIVRNVQGSVLYEGPLSSEADWLALRPLRPSLRQAAESFSRQGAAMAGPMGVKVWRLPLPDEYL